MQLREDGDLLIFEYANVFVFFDCVNVVVSLWACGCGNIWLRACLSVCIYVIVCVSVAVFFLMG